MKLLRLYLFLTLGSTAIIFSSCKSESEKKPLTVQPNDSIPAVAARSDADPSFVPTTIEQIQGAYEWTNRYAAEGKLDSVSFSYNCQNETGGTVSYYFYKGVLHLVIHKYHEYDHHQAEEQFFTLDSIPYFVYQRQTLWAFENGPEGTTRDDITEYRTYLLDQKPVQCLKKKFTIHSTSTTNPQPDSMANEKVHCSSETLRTFNKLWQFRNVKAPQCLDLPKRQL